MNCATPIPSGWGRRAQPNPEPPRRPWWGLPLGVLLVVGTSAIVFFAVQGLLR